MIACLAVITAIYCQSTFNVDIFKKKKGGKICLLFVGVVSTKMSITLFKTDMAVFDAAAAQWARVGHCSRSQNWDNTA